MSKLLRACMAPSVATLAATAVSLFSSPVHASGFSVARFGGAHGNPVDQHPASIYYNPAGLYGGAGTRVYLDLTYAYRTATYERDVAGTHPDNDTEAELAANAGKGTLANAVTAPMIGVSSDLGLAAPFALGAGFFVPFGGAAAWDQQDDLEDSAFPGAVDGPQRWFTIDGTLRTLGVAAGGAYHLAPARLSLGLTYNLYLSEIDSIRARNSDNTDIVANEGRSWIDVSGVDHGLGVGLLWEASPGALWLGASYQSKPNLDGKMVLEGTLKNHFYPNTDENDLVMTTKLPDVFRAGVRYRPTKASELRLFGDYTRWSTLDQQCLIADDVLGGEDPFEFCRTKDDGSTVNGNDSAVILNLERNWDDAWGARLAGSYWLAGGTELFVDLGYDANAIPDGVLDPSLIDMDKYSVGLGAVMPVSKWLDLSLSANNIFYADRTTSVSDFTPLKDPSKGPNPAGTFTQNVFFVNVGLLFHFGDAACEGCDGPSASAAPATQPVQVSSR
jgi:long-chain fatty acid transport protein